MATLIPKKYSEGSFEDAQYQAFGYDDATTNREIRRNNRHFNRYLNSDAGQRMRAQFKADAAALEEQKQQEAKAMAERLWETSGGMEGVMNSLQNYRNLNTPAEPEVIEVPVEPVLVPKISYWDRVAKQYGFADSNAVRNWQAQHGLVADGKIGTKTLEALRAQPTWKSVTVPNAFDETPVATVNIPSTKKPVPAKPQPQNINYPPRHVSWQK